MDVKLGLELDQGINEHKMWTTIYVFSYYEYIMWMKYENTTTDPFEPFLFVHKM